ncbi:ImmA/IrrE family metallo-endopeptidase [Paenibacillus sp. GCM10027627]|uniref:ImmA/IrrE family metallo-endopeptidase n=1 Tax=unclassified Paenibacillus TaxID=185978 RepID=UPI00363DC7DC
MELLDFDLYRCTDMERWIEEKYEANGIYFPGDLEDLDRIASLFGTHIAYTEGDTKVMYDEDGDSLIFLNIHLEEHEQRLAFFHELSHLALHSGDQRKLPASFVHLQETQAAHFQQYSAMPIHMLREFASLQHQPHYARLIAGAFGVPVAFAEARLERIARVIRQERSDRNLRTKLTSLSARACHPEYSDATKRLLAQLNRQTSVPKKEVNRV